MLIGVDSAESLKETLRGQRVAAVITGFGFGILLIAAIGKVTTGGFVGLTTANANGNVEGLAALIFSRYLWAFELTSALLITAAVGAMMLAHRERFERRKTQRELSQERFRPAGIRPRCPAPVSTHATTRLTSPRCCRTARTRTCRCPASCESAARTAKRLRTPKPSRAARHESG